MSKRFARINFGKSAMVKSLDTMTSEGMSKYITTTSSQVKKLQKFYNIDTSSHLVFW